VDRAAGALEPRLQLVGWPVLGIIFMPWTTMLYVLVAPGGVKGVDWLWIVLGVVVDITFWSGGAWKNRDRVPGSTV